MKVRGCNWKLLSVEGDSKRRIYRVGSPIIKSVERLILAIDVPKAGVPDREDEYAVPLGERMKAPKRIVETGYSD